MASYFPEAGNLNRSNAEMAGPSSSGSGDLFELSDRSNETISPTTSSTGRHLGFERDYNSHTAFRTCYVIIHKAYCVQALSNKFVTYYKIRRAVEQAFYYSRSGKSKTKGTKA